MNVLTGFFCHDKLRCGEFDGPSTKAKKGLGFRCLQFFSLRSGEAVLRRGVWTPAPFIDHFSAPTTAIESSIHWHTGFDTLSDVDLPIIISHENAIQARHQFLAGLTGDDPALAAAPWL